MSSRLTSAPLRAPVNVTWEITEACNLRCTHCLSAGVRHAASMTYAPATGPQGLTEGSNAPERELDFGQCLGLVDELARMQVFQINFGGGEPFLRSDFLDILRYCHRRGITTCVSTNGTVLDEALVGDLLEMWKSAPVYLQVSLDGACAETNDSIRGEGTFDRIMEGIGSLVERRYPELSLNMVVTRLNVGEMAEFVSLARQFGAKTRLSRLRPSGAACGSWEDYRLTRTQLLELSAFLGDHPEILTGDSFFSLTPASRRRLGLNMCGAAKMTCAVAPDGSVYPCAFLCRPEFLAGNALQQPLGEIFTLSRVFDSFRGVEVESCHGCKHFSECHGGCPAVAYFLTESTGVPDPECLRSAAAQDEVNGASRGECTISV